MRGISDRQKGGSFGGPDLDEIGLKPDVGKGGQGWGQSFPRNHRQRDVGARSIARSGMTVPSPKQVLRREGCDPRKFIAQELIHLAWWYGRDQVVLYKN